MVDKEDTSGTSTKPDGMETQEIAIKPPVNDQTKKRNIIQSAWDDSEYVNPKRQKLELDPVKKKACLKSIIEGFNYIFVTGFPMKEKQIDDKFFNVSVSHQITSIIFTMHNVLRQKIKGANTNMIKKNDGTDFQITVGGKTVVVARISTTAKWETICSANGLVYKEFAEDKDNWMGTMGPYLNFFGSFGLRLNELRVGHGIMPKTREDGVTKGFPVSQYGLTGAHHVLLEGSTYPPERRSSMAQSVGPMTAYLCMLRSSDKYRKKWEAAVKRDMSHISCIDEIIEATKNPNVNKTELVTLTSILADILLITTARQAHRMALPVNMLSYVHNILNDDGREELFKEFNASGRGAFATYKLACEQKWSISGTFTPEAAAQVVFHCIMGTSKEDFGILSEITNTQGWMTREQLGAGFKKKEGSAVVFSLPILNRYSKMSSANQSRLLAGVYNQVTSVPVFSGERVHEYTEDFFEHLNRKTCGLLLDATVEVITT